MTRVDFYILNSAGEAARMRFACRLAEKIFRAEQQLHIHTPDPATGTRLDEMLWTFRDGSFVPHRLEQQSPDGAPIVIGCTEPAAMNDHWQVLMNLTDQVPEFFSRFERVAEVVDASESAKAQGRDRYRFYQSRGYPLTTHNI